MGNEIHLLKGPYDFLIIIFHRFQTHDNIWQDVKEFWLWISQKKAVKFLNTVQNVEVSSGKDISDILRMFEQM